MLFGSVARRCTGSMLQGMKRRFSTHWAAPGLVVLALVGAWIGHTVEFVRVFGDRAQGTPMFAGVHAYMLPFAAVLLVLAGLGGGVLWSMWWRLGRRLAATRAVLRASLRGGNDAELGAERTPGAGVRLGLLWVPLTLLQISIYIVQENVEATALRHALPGLGVVLGIHSGALIVHTLIALFISAVVVAAWWPVQRRESAIAAIARLVRALVQRRRAADEPRRRQAPVAATARLMRWSLWCRPPPIPI